MENEALFSFGLTICHHCSKLCYLIVDLVEIFRSLLDGHRVIERHISILTALIYVHSHVNITADIRRKNVRKCQIDTVSADVIRFQINHCFPVKKSFLHQLLHCKQSISFACGSDSTVIAYFRRIGLRIRKDYRFINAQASLYFVLCGSNFRRFSSKNGSS